MTLEEKAQMCAGEDFWHVHGVERLGIPSMMVADGPHGLRKQDDKADHLGVNDSIKAVCFPAGCATACGFDVTVMERMGMALGESCRAEGVGVLLGPAMNIKRSPLCGRNFEYLSEDPYLAGKLSAAMIRGVQSWGVGTSPKHFACNNQEFRRMSISAEMDERTLREIYLAGFETAVKEGKPYTMMCSYNRVGGVYASQNKHLLSDILRDEWGFDGFVMSDWGAVSEKLEAVKAGLELEMPGPCPDSVTKVVEAVASGALDEEVLDQAVARILSVVLKWRDTTVAKAVFDRVQQHQLAVELESQCAVLMKNNGVLPLRQEQQVVYLGGYAQKPRYQGGGSSHINASKVMGAVELASDSVQFCEAFRDNVPLDMDKAVEKAQEAKVAVIFAGLPDSFECEGYDRNHMDLPRCQNELIERVASVQPNTVVVLHCGSPVHMPWKDRVAAILCMYLGGEGVGEATHALLYGDVNPSGKLAETWPLRLEDNPSFLNFPGDEHEVHYAEGIYVGYRYYDKKKMAVAYPFGYGLSYTTFRYSNLTVSQTQMEEGGEVQVSVNVTNTGTRFGQESVQLYVASHQSNRPEKELKGFAKVALEPGETKCVRMRLDSHSFGYYETKIGSWYTPSGEYEVLIGASSRDIRLVKTITFHTHRQLPIAIEMDTTVGELLAHPKTSKLMQELLDSRRTVLDERSDGESAKEAITDEMTRQMLINSPMCTLSGWLQLSEAEMERWLAELEEIARA